MSVSLVALGDSLSCGQGVGLAVAPDRTWPAVLAAGSRIPVTVTVTARAGARARDVREQQLPVALEARPDVASVLVGLNDVIRAGWSPAAVADDLRATAVELSRAGAHVLLWRLHDPTAVLPLPRRAAAGARRRVELVNAAVDAAANAVDGTVLDLADVAPLRLRAGYAVDRLHPTEAAHAALAAHAARALGWPSLDPPEPGRAPSSLVELRWAVRHGLPWLVERRRQVVLPVLQMGGRRVTPS